MRTASLLSGGRSERTERTLMLALADGAAIARGTAKAASDDLVTGLRVTVWATARKGGSLVANRVRIEDAD
jgi:hypothetical protein